MATVNLYCKTPNGFTLEVGNQKVVIAGYNNVESNIIYDRSTHGIGVTYDVSQELWDKWRSVYKDHPLVVNGLVWEAKSDNNAKAEAKEKKSVKTGTEQKTREELSKKGASPLNSNDGE